jgi:hypothetical protein
MLCSDRTTLSVADMEYLVEIPMEEVSLVRYGRTCFKLELTSVNPSLSRVIHQESICFFLIRCYVTSDTKSADGLSDITFNNGILPEC